MTTGKRTMIRKMFFMPEEKQGIMLGTIASGKKTETYKRAKEYFEKTTERLKNEDYTILSETSMVVDENEGVVSMYFIVELKQKDFGKQMRESLEKSQQDMNKKFTEIFGGFNDIFDDFKKIFT